MTNESSEYEFFGFDLLFGQVVGAKGGVVTVELRAREGGTRLLKLTADDIQRLVAALNEMK